MRLFFQSAATAALLAASGALGACAPPGAPAAHPSPMQSAGPERRPAAPGKTDAAPGARAASESPTATRRIVTPETDWGGGGPTALVATSPDGSWLVTCEARNDSTGDGRIAAEVGPDGLLTGDALTGFFVEHGGPGEAVEAFVGSDPTGRWVALVQGGKLVLRDTAESRNTTLDADLRDDSATFGPSRLGAFDPTGRRFLYHRAKAGAFRVVVRELTNGSETEVDPGPGAPHRADFDPTGEWVTLRVVVDTSGDGRVEWPVPVSPPFMRCHLPVPRFAVFAPGPDSVVTRVARLDGSAAGASGEASAPGMPGVTGSLGSPGVTGSPARDAPGLVVPLGDALVIREPDGSLVRIAADGARRRLTEPTCAARVLHAAPEHGALLASCKKRNGRMDVRWLGSSGSKALGLELGVAVEDLVLPGAPRLVPLHPGSDAVLVDMKDGTLTRLLRGDKIVATSGTWALLVRRRRVVLRDAQGSEERLLGELAPFSHVLRAGNVVAVASSVVDVGSGRLLGATPERALAVATDGRVLVATGGAADARSPARGPLRWYRPLPPAAPDAVPAGDR